MGKLQVKYGTEGPSYDPYSYTEITVTWENGLTVFGHVGLLNVTKISRPCGHPSQIEGEGASIVFEQVTGLPPYRWVLLFESLNTPPSKCPECHKPVSFGSGYVGETIAYCDNKDCSRGILWEDSEEAISRCM